MYPMAILFNQHQGQTMLCVLLLESEKNEYSVWSLMAFYPGGPNSKGLATGCTNGQSTYLGYRFIGATSNQLSSMLRCLLKVLS